MKNDGRPVVTINPLRWLLWGFMGLVVGLVFLSSWYTVDSGQRAVLLTWGEANTVSVEPGLHFKVPLAQFAVKVSVQTQKYTTDAAAASKDLQVVTSSIAVNYRLAPESVPRLYQEIGLDYSERVIQPAVQEVVKATTAQFTAEELITRRAEVKDEVKVRLAERLQPRGLVVEEISIVNFDFSPSFNEAIEAKVTAEQLKLKAERDLERIRIEAEQIAATAEGQKDAKIAQAQAEAESIRIVQDQLDKSPEYVEWYKVNRWDGKLPLVTGSVTPLVALPGATI